MSILSSYFDSSTAAMVDYNVEIQPPKNLICNRFISKMMEIHAARLKLGGKCMKGGRTLEAFITNQTNRNFKNIINHSNVFFRSEGFNVPLILRNIG